MTAALMNAHVRDNLIENPANTAAAAGDILYADAANSVNGRLAIGSATSLLASTGSAPVWRLPTSSGTTNTSVISSNQTSYTALNSGTWGGTNTTATVTTGTAVFVFLRALMFNDTAGAQTRVSYSVSGASTVATSAARMLGFESSASNDIAIIGTCIYQSGLTAGSNVFTMEGRVTAGTGSLQYTQLTVLPL